MKRMYYLSNTTAVVCLTYKWQITKITEGTISHEGDVDQIIFCPEGPIIMGDEILRYSSNSYCTTTTSSVSLSSSTSSMSESEENTLQVLPPQQYLLWTGFIFQLPVIW